MLYSHPYGVVTDRPTAMRLPLQEGDVPPPEPITEAEIREELRITFADEAHRIESLAIAAREWIEEQYALALIPGQHLCVVTARDGRLDLPIHPVTAVLGVRQRDASDGVGTALDPDDWWVDLAYRPARVYVGGGCATYGVVCETGWTAVDIPQPLKHAISLWVWGQLDAIATADWMNAVAVKVRPYAVRGL